MNVTFSVIIYMKDENHSDDTLCWCFALESEYFMAFNFLVCSFLVRASLLLLLRTKSGFFFPKVGVRKGSKKRCNSHRQSEKEVKVIRIEVSLVIVCF